MGQLPKIVVERLRAAAMPTRPANGGVRSASSTQGLSHPDADLLTAFVEQALAGQEREQVLGHLAACGVCRDVIALSAPEIAVSAPASAAAVTGGWLRWPALRWGTAAAVVAIGVIGVSLYRNDQQPAASQTAQVQARSNSVPASAPPLAEEKVETKKEQVPSAKADATAAPGARIEEPRTEAAALPVHARRIAGEDANVVHIPSKADVVALQPAAAPVVQPAHVDEPSGMVAVASGQPASGVDTFNGEVAVAQPSTLDKTFNLPPQTSPWGGAPAIGGRTQTADTRAGAAGAPVTVATESRSKASFRGLHGLGSFGVKQSLLGKNALSAGGNEAEESDTPPVVLNARWTISPFDGKLMRSVDNGRSWQTVNVSPGGAWRAVNANNPDVWVGGNNGALYHSSDNGVHWRSITPSAGERKLASDVTRIEFADTMHGHVHTSAGEVWSTIDGGRTWSVLP